MISFTAAEARALPTFFPHSREKQSRDGVEMDRGRKLWPPLCKTSEKKKKLFSERNPEQRACLCLHMHTGYLSCVVLRITTAGLRAALAPLLHGTLPGCIWSSSGPVGCVWTSTKASSTRATDNMATLKKLTAAVVAYVTE